MTGRQRCDEILRLIDEALMEPQPSDAPAAPRALATASGPGSR